MSKTISSPLATHLAGNSTTMAMCWYLKRRDGVVLGFTDHDEDITVDVGYGSVTYVAATGFTPTAIQNKADLSVDNLEVDGPLIVDGSVTLSSEALTDDDLRAGLYDFAEIRIFEVNWADLTMGPLRQHRGFVGPVEMSDIQFKAQLLGLQQAYTRNLIRVYRIGCDADLFDARCGLSPTSPNNFVETGVVTSIVKSRREFQATITGARPAGFFDGGRLTWTSGANLGRLPIEMKVVTDVSGAEWDVLLWLSTPYVVRVGDTFSAQAGCDKSAATCKAKFNNLLNFRGFPFIPGLNAAAAAPNV